MVWGFKNPQGMRVDSTPSLFPLFEDQLDYNIWSCTSMSQIVSKTIIKLMMSRLVPCDYAVVHFWGQSQTFDQLLFGHVSRQTD